MPTVYLFSQTNASESSEITLCPHTAPRTVTMADRRVNLTHRVITEITSHHPSIKMTIIISQYNLGIQTEEITNRYSSIMDMANFYRTTQGYKQQKQQQVFKQHGHGLRTSIVRAWNCSWKKKEEISRGVRGHAPPENFES